MIFKKLKSFFAESVKSNNQTNLREQLSFSTSSRQKEKRIYFDYASASPVEDFVLEKYNQVAKENFANASSIHMEGEKSKEILLEAKMRVAKCIKARSHNVHFTGSATEANNIFIKGVDLGGGFAAAQIMYSGSDHSAIIEPILWCKKFFKTDIVDVRPNKIAKIWVEDVVKKLNVDTKLICLSYVNSEVGAMQEVKKIVQGVREYWDKNFKAKNYPKIFIDATQAIKYFEIDVHNLGVDGISFGLSKIGGVPGCAVLWVKDQTKLESIISGGGQEEGIRSGTENIPAIVANSYLLTKICDRKLQEKNREYVYGLRNYLIQNLQAFEPLIKGSAKRSEGQGDFVTIFGDTHFKYNKFYENAAPHILLISLKDMLGEELCLRLEARGISVSTATACSLLENSGSNFLKSVNEPMLAKETIRISLSEKNTKEEIDKFVNALRDIASKYVF